LGGVNDANLTLAGKTPELVPDFDGQHLPSGDHPVKDKTDASGREVLNAHGPKVQNLAENAAFNLRPTGAPSRNPLVGGAIDLDAMPWRTGVLRLHMSSLRSLFGVCKLK
jgi:hypothetical protein